MKKVWQIERTFKIYIWTWYTIVCNGGKYVAWNNEVVGSIRRVSWYLQSLKDKITTTQKSSVLSFVEHAYAAVELFNNAQSIADEE